MIDTHCHLAGEEFAGDLPEVVARATAAGVTCAVCILAAGDAEEAARAATVKEAWPAVRFAAGIHPHQAGQWAGRIDEAVGTVRERIRAHAACAIGEIGLDYHYDFSPRDVQHEVFGAQLRLARELGLPVVIHTREAADDTFRILAEQGAGLPGVFHCFTGDLAMARRVLAIDFHLSFAGIVTFPKAGGLREVAAFAPAERILAETDSPYLAPVPHRGKRNEPAHVAHVYGALAELRGADRGALAAQLGSNFRALFGGAR